MVKKKKNKNFLIIGKPDETDVRNQHLPQIKSQFHSPTQYLKQNLKHT